MIGGRHQGMYLPCKVLQYCGNPTNRPSLLFQVRNQSMLAALKLQEKVCDFNVN